MPETVAAEDLKPGQRVRFGDLVLTCKVNKHREFDGHHYIKFVETYDPWDDAPKGPEGLYLRCFPHPSDNSANFDPSWKLVLA